MKQTKQKQKINKLFEQSHTLKTFGKIKKRKNKKKKPKILRKWMGGDGPEVFGGADLHAESYIKNLWKFQKKQKNQRFRGNGGVVTDWA